MSLNVAVAGCVHGELNNIYDELSFLESRQGIKADILLCCGDFQAVRDTADLDSLICPEKYKVAGDFPAYYSGQRVAPVLTIVIGGNHEASRHTLENFLGGWLAPNIFFLGFAGVVNFRGLRIGGLSGIFKAPSFHLPLTRTPTTPPLCPFKYPTTSPPLPPRPTFAFANVYHVRSTEVAKLAAYPAACDILLTHDWPTGAATSGPPASVAAMAAKRPDLAKDAAVLGNPALVRLLRAAGVLPRRWYAAHLHWPHAAAMGDTADPSAAPRSVPSGPQPSAMVGADDDDSAAHALPPSALRPRRCSFTALSKPHPHRHDFVTLVTVPRPPDAGDGTTPTDATSAAAAATAAPARPQALRWDPEWLAITALSRPPPPAAAAAPLVPSRAQIDAAADALRERARGVFDDSACTCVRDAWAAVGPSLAVPRWGDAFWDAARCPHWGHGSGQRVGAVGVSDGPGGADGSGGAAGGPEGAVKRPRDDVADPEQVAEGGGPPDPSAAGGDVQLLRLAVGECVEVCGQRCAVCAVRRLLGMGACYSMA